MAIDESTTIKTPTAKRTKNIINLAVSAKYRRIMTGSPVTKNPLDLFTQCDFLSPWLLNFTSGLISMLLFYQYTDELVDSFQ